MDAIFLGSFNPPHIGHLNVIQSVLDSKFNNELDKIHIIPCNQNPNKIDTIPYWIRYRMCTEMFRGLSDKVIIDDLEANHNFTFTYNMLMYLQYGDDKFISNDFKWIITQETLNEICNDKWYNSTEIISRFGSRMIIVNNDGKSKIFGIGVFDSQYVKLHPGIDIHSTNIRNLVKENKSINLYVNQGVIDIIKTENLYK